MALRVPGDSVEPWANKGGPTGNTHQADPMENISSGPFNPAQGDRDEGGLPEGCRAWMETWRERRMTAGIYLETSPSRRGEEHGGAWETGTDACWALLLARLCDHRVIAHLSWPTGAVRNTLKAHQGGLLRPFHGRSCSLSPGSILHLFLSPLLPAWHQEWRRPYTILKSNQSEHQD